MKKTISLLILAALILAAIGLYYMDRDKGTDQNKSMVQDKGMVPKKSVEKSPPAQVAKPQPVFTVKSEAFADNGKIPATYANNGVSGGSNVSVPLSWSDAPAGTKSFTIIMYDLHPIANNWIHWAIINIPAQTTALDKGASLTTGMPAGCTELNNTFGTKGYGGPQPPAGSGDHQYRIIMYALNTEKLSFSNTSTVASFKQAIQGKTLGQAQLTGVFGR